MSNPSSRARAKRTAPVPDGLEIVALPAPAACRTALGLALKRRRTTREYAKRELTAGLLSDLLWAACGVNRRKGPFAQLGRTTASASNSQEIDVYLALGHGTFRYDADQHRLLRVTTGDLRPFAISRGQRPLGSDAAVRLIYVADVERLAHTAGFDEPGLRDPDVQRSYYYVDTGLIAAHVYLQAAACGLGAWFHNCDRAQLARRLRLSDTQRVLFAQTVGHPA